MEEYNSRKLKHGQAERISAPIMHYLKSTGLYDGLYAWKVSEAWDNCSGIGRYTINRYLKDNVLYVTLSSSALRSRVRCQLPAVMKKINDTLLVDEIFAGRSISGIVLK